MIAYTILVAPVMKFLDANSNEPCTVGGMLCEFEVAHPKTSKEGTHRLESRVG